MTKPTTDFSQPERFEQFPGGALTSFKIVNADSFSHSSANMSFERELDFKVGNGFFRRFWVSSPSSTRSADGLGPLFNSRACQSCHLKDGRGRPPAVGMDRDNDASSMFLRLSIPPQSDEQHTALKSGRRASIPEPTYGNQLQDFAIQGHRPEGRMEISHRERKVTMAGGETVSLRAPTYGISGLGYGPLHPEVMTSPRLTPQMIGLGLLEAVDEAEIEALADPDDRDGDGISGRVNRVWSPSLDRIALGRFGWKAGAATIEDQAAAAFSGDIGISTVHFPDASGDCTGRQTACRAAPNGNDPDGENVEAPKAVLDLVTFYSRNLAVPARRNSGDPQVLAGKKAFYAIGCIGCHRPKFITPRNIPHLPEQARQLIWPYTDMLLHDMGKGLADDRPEGRANGREWRTAPLWGIGLTETVSGHTFFLHDGRARNLTEAILWHGGESEASRERFRNL
ncbi:MAG: di-heme oxidoredictase family protein, partial [Rhodospirillaceae bacterium]